MTNEKKRYNVTIFGQDYTLISSEHEEQVRQAARLVDEIMQEIAGKSATIDQQKVAVLAALHIAASVVQGKAAAAHQVQRHQALIETIDALCG